MFQVWNGLFQKLLLRGERPGKVALMLLDAETSTGFLKEELARRMRANPRYSQRAFARQLGLSPGELCELLAGKRALSLKSALRVARALGLSPAETRHLIQLAQVERGRRLGAPELLEPLRDDAAPSRELTLDMFRVVSDWYCFAILNLLDCDDFQSDAGWIARRLGISRLETELALERLERVGLVERDRRGELRGVKDYVLSPAGIPSEAIRNYHRQILGKAIEALETQGVGEREISGVGLAVDPVQLPALKKEIVEFQDRLVAKYARGRRKTEVYQLESALFRLTARRKEP
jgi:uncharacterized protein (TIGR02147 family)